MNKFTLNNLSFLQGNNLILLKKITCLAVWKHIIIEMTPFPSDGF